MSRPETRIFLEKLGFSMKKKLVVKRALSSKHYISQKISIAIQSGNSAYVLGTLWMIFLYCNYCARSLKL